LLLEQQNQSIVMVDIAAQTAAGTTACTAAGIAAGTTAGIAVGTAAGTGVVRLRTFYLFSNRMMPADQRNRILYLKIKRLRTIFLATLPFILTFCNSNNFKAGI